MKAVVFSALPRLCFVVCALLASGAALSGPDQDLLDAASKGELIKGACATGQLEIVKILLAAGVNVGTASERSATALSIARENNNALIIGLLEGGDAK